jgi:hypothetical protein
MVEFDELLSTLEMWADQLASLKVRAVFKAHQTCMEPVPIVQCQLALSLKARV